MKFIEIRFFCGRYSESSGGVQEGAIWQPLSARDSRHFFRYLELQLPAYPRVKTLVFDFVGWDLKEVHKPGGYLREKYPSWVFRRIPEIIIRGLSGEQLEMVVEQVTPYVSKRVGTTSSHYCLADGGLLARVTDTEIRWRDINSEEKHPLLEEF